MFENPILPNTTPALKAVSTTKEIALDVVKKVLVTVITIGIVALPIKKIIQYFFPPLVFATRDSMDQKLNYQFNDPRGMCPGVTFDFSPLIVQHAWTEMTDHIGAAKALDVHITPNSSVVTVDVVTDYTAVDPPVENRTSAGKVRFKVWAVGTNR